MLNISDDDFTKLIGQALDELPQDYVQRMLKDVAVTWDEEPTPEQRTQLKLHCNQTLFGLYEGLPLTNRYSGANKIVPDKITIFKNPIVAYSKTERDLVNQVKNTVWHEMAHYFGLDHKRIHELEP